MSRRRSTPALDRAAVDEALADGARLLVGKACIVTGANTGIGRAVALELARAGAHVLVGARDEGKGLAAVEAIQRESGNERVELLQVDLGSLASVRQAAEGFLARGLSLPLLINNAGVAGQRGVTRDGFELAFGTNHLGHFLWTTLLLERLVASAPARVVSVSSKSHYDAKGLDLDAVCGSTRSFTGLPEYAVSKLCNVLFTAELARRLEGKGVSTYAVHPGVVASDAWRRIPWPIRAIMKRGMLTNEEGARRVLHPALAPALAAESGRYYDAYREHEPLALGRDAALARQLWERSEAFVAEAG